MLTHAPTNVGSRIRAARLARHWTQAQLHIAAGVALSDLSKIETGRMLASRGQLKRLAGALGLTDHDIELDQLDGARA